MSHFNELFVGKLRKRMILRIFRDLMKTAVGLKPKDKVLADFTEIQTKLLYQTNKSDTDFFRIISHIRKGEQCASALKFMEKNEDWQSSEHKSVIQNLLDQAYGRDGERKILFLRTFLKQTNPEGNHLQLENMEKELLSGNLFYSITKPDSFRQNIKKNATLSGRGKFYKTLALPDFEGTLKR
jgi:hypothetical protein